MKRKGKKIRERGARTHWKSQEAYSDLDTADDDHGMFYPTASKPVVGEEGKDEAEHVFKHE